MILVTVAELYAKLASHWQLVAPTSYGNLDPQDNSACDPVVVLEMDLAIDLVRRSVEFPIKPPVALLVEDIALTPRMDLASGSEKITAIALVFPVEVVENVSVSSC